MPAFAEPDPGRRGGRLSRARRLRRISPGHAVLLTAIVACAFSVNGQETASPAADLAVQNGGRGAAWEVGLDAYFYLVEGGSYLLPIITVDHGALHMEGRYQYEDLRTGSAWFGWTFGTGEAVQLEIVPMAGFVVGRTRALAPGCELTLAWKAFELYSENELVFNLDSSDDDFFYSWNEVGWQARPWLRLGLTAQFTEASGDGFESDNGVFVAFSHGVAELLLYAYDLASEDAFGIVALSWAF